MAEPHNVGWLVVDTETSALADFKLPADHPSQPYLASLAMLALDADLNVTQEFLFLIRPDGWVMEPGATAVNGLTTERLQAEGVPVTEALERYVALLDEGRAVASHHAQHDCKMLRSALRRNGLDDRFETTRTVCTMRALTAVCALPQRNGRGLKWPTLGEALAHFDLPYVGGHSALADAHSCHALLRAMAKLDIIPEPRVHRAKEPLTGSHVVAQTAFRSMESAVFNRRQVLLTYCLEYGAIFLSALCLGLSLWYAYNGEWTGAASQFLYFVVNAMLAYQQPRFRRYVLAPLPPELPSREVRVANVAVSCPRCGATQFTGHRTGGITCDACHMDFIGAFLEFGPEGPQMRLEPAPDQQPRLH